MTADPIGVLRLLAKVFSDTGIKYAIVGSTASSVHGVYRATADVDCIARLTRQDAVALSRAMDLDFYVDPESVMEAVLRIDGFNVLSKETMGKVDVFVAKPDLWSQLQLSRSIWVSLDHDGQTFGIFVASPEDTILSKLRWYRLGNEVSNSQWTDAQGVLKVQADALDFDYLTEWAAELKVADLLVRARDDAGV